MKLKKWITLGVALSFLLAAQPAYAAPVVTAGVNQSVQIPEEAAQGAVQSSGVVAGEAPTGAGQSSAPAPANASSQAPSAAETAPQSDGTSIQQSPTITSGQNQTAAPGTAETNASSAPVSAGEVTGIPEGPGGIKSDPVTPVLPEEKAAQDAAQAADAGQAAAQQAGTVDPSRPMVALTFDDGPQPSVGNRIMDCLAQYGGKATFFMVGDRVGSYKTEVRRMVAEGHEVANHTMNHKYLQKLGAAQIQAQVNQGNDAIQAACGVRPILLRLPGGNHNATVMANAGMPMIQWNVDTLDWKTRNADKTVAAVLNHVKDGDIILMHELYASTGDAVLRIVPELHKRGFQMVTVSQMAAAKGKTLEAGKLYSSFN
mgnify:CR=1 FL=1